MIAISGRGILGFEGNDLMSIVSEDLLTLKQAEEVPTSSGMTLSRRQIHHLCTNGKLAAQKIGAVWLVSRKSIEAYAPEETGFAVVWKKRHAKQAALDGEIKKAVSAAKSRVTPASIQGRRRGVATVLDESINKKRDTWAELDKIVLSMGEKPRIEDFPRCQFGRELIDFEEA